MNSSQNTVYAYFSRMAFFCAFATVFLLVHFMMDFQMSFLPLLYLIPFTIFFAVRALWEHLARRGGKPFAGRALSGVLYIAFQLAVLIIFTFYVRSIDFNARVFNCAALFIMAGFCLASNSYDFPNSAFKVAIALNICVTVLIMYLQEGTGFSYAALALLAISIISFIICRFYRQLSFATNRSIWSAQPGDTVRRVSRRSERYMYTFVCGGIVVMLLLLAPSYLRYEADRERPDRAAPLISALDSGTHTEYEMQARDNESDASEEEFSREGYYYTLDKERLQRFLNILGWAVFAPVMAFALMYFYVWLSGRIRGRDSNPEYGDDDEGYEEEAFFTGKRSPAARSITLKPNRAARAIFKKKVNEHRRQWLVLRPNDTAGRIAANIAEREDISDISDLYHIARYSNARLTAEDIAAVKRRKSKSQQ